MDSIRRVIEEIKKHQRQDNAPRGIFPASATDRWLNCPKSSQLAKDIPAESSKYAEEGKLAHKVCEAYYYKKMWGLNYPEDLNKELFYLDDAGEEMEGHAAEYFKIIERITNNPNSIGTPLYVALEKYMYVDDVRDETRVAGMADYLVIGTKGCAVIDFKYGKGQAVNARTPQLLTYLTALKNIDIERYNFIAVIHQPRVENSFSFETYHKWDLLKHYDMITDTRMAYNSVATELKMGSHCRWCPAKRTKDLDKKCPIIDKKEVDTMWEKFKEATMAMEKAKTKVGPERDKLMHEFFSVLPELMELKTTFEAEIMNRIDKGEEVKGFKVTERPGRRKWTGTPEETGALLESRYPTLGGNYGATVKKMRTITEIEKKIGKGKLDAFTVTSPATKKLTVVDAVSVDELFAQAGKEVV